MRGLTVALVGVDGAGKSSISSALVEDPLRATTRIYMGANPASATHMLPTTRAWLAARGWLGRDAHESGPPDPSRLRRRPAHVAGRLAAHAKSLAVLALTVSEESYRFLVAGVARRRGRLVILDRHPLTDYYGAHVRGTRGWRRLGDRIHGALVMRVYPRPDQVVFLDAPAEILFARKPEGSVAALEARRAEYLALSEAVPDLIVVDANRPFDEVLLHVRGLTTDARRSADPSPAPQQDEAADGMLEQDVITILKRLGDDEVPAWLDRGWGVDAIVGRATRPHQDLDLVTIPGAAHAAVASLEQLGFRRTEAAELTTELVRTELCDARGRSVDIREAAEALDKSFGALGELDGVPVACVDAAQQLAWRTGRRLSKTDVEAIGLLHDRLGVPLPHALRPMGLARTEYRLRRAARSLVTLGHPDQPLPRWARSLRRPKKMSAATSRSPLSPP